MSNSNFGKGLIAFVSGAAVGAALGILFAPDKGVKTRKKIAKKTRDITDSAREKLEDFIESAEEIVDELKENASNFMSRNEEIFDDVKEDKHKDKR
ncbi:YtxH domain-containing protein [Bacteroidales bacterium OttesenSCG-928-I21]|nr:YtxH domain-containing protein [Bacteroidales bacterium OttesenSCG-928-I21]